MQSRTFNMLALLVNFYLRRLCCFIWSVPLRFDKYDMYNYFTSLWSHGCFVCSIYLYLWTSAPIHIFSPSFDVWKQRWANLPSLPCFCSFDWAYRHVSWNSYSLGIRQKSLEIYFSNHIFFFKCRYSEWIDECERVNSLEDDGA